MSRVSRKKKKGEKNKGYRRRIVNQRQSQSFEHFTRTSFARTTLRPAGVSHALWPLQVRRHPVTSKIAQRRRLMITKGDEWFRKLKPYRHKKLLTSRSTLHIYLLYTTLAISFLIMGILLAIFMLRPWPVTILLVVLWIATTALTTRLWSVCVRMSLVSKQTVKQVTKHAAKQVSKQPLPTIAKTRPIVVDHFHSGTINHPIPNTRPLFPLTPMPSTPLVRVLETIDLSSTNVEHFLDSIQEQQVPRSQMGTAPDVVIHHADEQTDKRVDIHMNKET